MTKVVVSENKEMEVVIDEWQNMTKDEIIAVLDIFAKSLDM